MSLMDQDELIFGSEVLRARLAKKRMRSSGWWLVVGGGLWLEEVLLKVSEQRSRGVCCK
jgi:hypothetical protein